MLDPCEKLNLFLLVTLYIVQQYPFNKITYLSKTLKMKGTSNTVQ